MDLKLSSQEVSFLAIVAQSCPVAPEKRRFIEGHLKKGGFSEDIADICTLMMSPQDARPRMPGRAQKEDIAKVNLAWVQGMRDRQAAQLLVRESELAQAQRAVAAARRRVYHGPRVAP